MAEEFIATLSPSEINVTLTLERTVNEDDEVTITLSAIQQAKEKLEDSSTNSIAKIKTVLLEFFEGIGE